MLGNEPRVATKPRWPMMKRRTPMPRYPWRCRSAWAWGCLQDHWGRRLPAVLCLETSSWARTMGLFFCSKHNTSALRKKRIEGRLVNCQGCGAALNTSYEEFSFCPVCSNRQHKCMICGGEEADGAVPRDLPVSPARGDLNGAPQAPDPPHGHGSYGPMPDVLSRAAQDTPASKPPSPQRPGTAETQPADPWTAGIPPRPGSETTSESRPVPPRPASFGRFGSGYPGSFSNSNMPGRPQQSSLYPGQSVPAPRYQAPPPPPLAPSPFGAVPTPGLPVRMQSATHDAYAWGGSVGTGPWAQPVPRWGSSRR
mmetsp:Transcript_50835/g.115627  ORF Transcript_50835/g.115627 Transcript_50835/m.115627 type:complete len:310 (-) Transcript_50835:181-1110(-)